MSAFLRCALEVFDVHLKDSLIRKRAYQIHHEPALQIVSPNQGALQNPLPLVIVADIEIHEDVDDEPAGRSQPKLLPEIVDRHLLE